MFTEGLLKYFLLVLADSLNNKRFALKDFIFLWKKPKPSPFKDTQAAAAPHFSYPKKGKQAELILL